MKNIRFFCTLCLTLACCLALSFSASAQFVQDPLTQKITTNPAFNTAPSANVVVGNSTSGARLVLATPPNFGFPTLELQTSTADYDRIRFTNANSGFWDIAGLIGATDAADLLIFNNNAVGNILSLTGSGNVGIGTTNPSAKLQVQGTILAGPQNATDEGGELQLAGAASNPKWSLDTYNSRFRIHSSNTERVSVLQNGNVGIGTSSPSAKLHVQGTILTGPQNATDEGGELQLAGAASYPKWSLDAYNDRFRIHSSNTERVSVLQNGNVGIGTTNPTYKLAVNGTIRAKEIRVESGWADYVFGKNFHLRPLAEVEQFIRKNKHLPDVTPAAEIQANGLQVAKVMTEMMQKIEELTLYLIQLDKDNTSLRQEVENMKHK